MNKMSKNQSGFGAIELAVIFMALVLLIGTGWLIYVRHKKSSGDVSRYIPSSNYAVGVKFKGRVTANTCNGAGGCYITMNASTIVWYGYGNTTRSGPHGRLMNYSSPAIGKSAEVYAHQLSKNAYTLQGSSDYYVKITN